MKRLIWLLLISSCFAQTWATWNGITVGSSSTNISGWNGTTIGTSSTNIGAWNGLVSPGGGGGLSCTYLGAAASSNGSSVSVSFSATTSGHDIIILQSYSGSPTTTDSATQTYTMDGTAFTHSGSYTMKVVRKNNSASITSASMSSGFSAVMAMAVYDCSGLTGYDTGNGNDSSFQSASWTSNSATSAQNVSYLLGMVLDTGTASQTYTPTAGTWTSGCDATVSGSYATNFTVCFMHQTTAATGSYAASGTNSVTTNSDKGTILRIYN